MQRCCRTSLIFLSILLLTILTGCSNNLSESKPKAQEIYVSAAASLNQAMGELTKAYETQNSGTKIIANFGGSGTLQKQIEQGAPVDLFISAGEPQMNALVDKSLIQKESRINLLQNDLVLITLKGAAPISMEELAKSGVNKIAIGIPETVPAGRYAKETLKAYDLWDELQPKLVFAKDVTQVRSYVETGNVEAGFVYSSDAKTSSKVEISTTIPPSKHSPIVYPAAIVTTGKNVEGAKSFLSFLQTSQAISIFEKYGFKKTF